MAVILTEAECTTILPEFSRWAMAALKPCPTAQPQPTNDRVSDPARTERIRGSGFRVVPGGVR